MIGRKDKKGIREPNFFIVGAAKCGTTSLADNLKQHPQIFISPRKEPFYFVKDARIGYKDFNEYMALFKNAGDAIAIGEASTGYLFEESAPYEIKKHFPDAKIIVILRNPVDMAYSHWRHMCVVGNEAKTFEEAISERERKYRKTENFKRKVVDWWATYLYLERALYYNQIKRYFDVFGRDRVR
ncbi:MAG: sulfotransferase, partial [Deltaproteobacteria bacterium]|nr:sulfotransferase [Deltaproteobacteria bacterium]